ncbi:hypothetical protein [Burkholderia cepacia]|uniref:hypothetical protein n=1 Tax=Burkholderia cepacia TaxID=292 RepID=UPI001885BE27|nr:hypothetical protein [Burkholderia cepacia]
MTVGVPDATGVPKSQSLIVSPEIGCTAGTGGVPLFSAWGIDTSGGRSLVIRRRITTRSLNAIKTGHAFVAYPVSTETPS